jgi:hypothetical protein
VTGTLTIIREAALEHKLRVSLLPLSNYRLGEQLISFSLDAIATTAVVEHNRGLIRLDHVLLILKTPVFVGKTLVKPLLPYLLRQLRLPRWLCLVVTRCSEDSPHRCGGYVEAVSTKITSNISTALLSSIAITSYFLNCSSSNSFLLTWATSTRSVFEVLWEELD